jgi:hypothetical protein
MKIKIKTKIFLINRYDRIINFKVIYNKRKFELFRWQLDLYLAHLLNTK